jgi:hypothetical protein
MSTDANPNPSAAGLPGPHGKPDAEPDKLAKLPGLIAISLYMILLAGAVVISVVQHHREPFFLVLPVLFIAAGLGLMLLQRWAWALTLSAVALSAGFFFWTYVTQPQAYGFLVQGLFNLVIFLYLVRADVRKKLR